MDDTITADEISNAYFIMKKAGYDISSGIEYVYVGKFAGTFNIGLHYSLYCMLTEMWNIFTLCNLKEGKFKTSYKLPWYTYPKITITFTRHLSHIV